MVILGPSMASETLTIYQYIANLTRSTQIILPVPTVCRQVPRSGPSLFAGKFGSMRHFLWTSRKIRSPLWSSRVSDSATPEKISVGFCKRCHDRLPERGKRSKGIALQNIRRIIGGFFRGIWFGHFLPKPDPS
jgi:hypothetical protein